MMRDHNPFKRVFDLFDKVAIAGAPKTGKTTLAKLITDRAVFHSDDLLTEGMPWSGQSADLAANMNVKEGKFVVEGMTVPRALRKGMKVDAVIWLNTPKVDQTKGQVTMGKAARTVFNEWRAANPDVPIYAEPVERYSPFEEENEDSED